MPASFLHSVIIVLPLLLALCLNHSASAATQNYGCTTTAVVENIDDPTLVMLFNTATSGCNLVIRNVSVSKIEFATNIHLDLASVDINGVTCVSVEGCINLRGDAPASLRRSFSIRNIVWRPDPFVQDAAQAGFKTVSAVTMRGFAADGTFDLHFENIVVNISGTPTRSPQMFRVAAICIDSSNANPAGSAVLVRNTHVSFVTDPSITPMQTTYVVVLQLDSSLSAAPTDLPGFLSFTDCSVFFSAILAPGANPRAGIVRVVAQKTMTVAGFLALNCSVNAVSFTGNDFVAAILLATEPRTEFTLVTDNALFSFCSVRVRRLEAAPASVTAVSAYIAHLGQTISVIGRNFTVEGSIVDVDLATVSNGVADASQTVDTAIIGLRLTSWIAAKQSEMNESWFVVNSSVLDIRGFVTAAGSRVGFAVMDMQNDPAMQVPIGGGGIIVTGSRFVADAATKSATEQCLTALYLNCEFAGSTSLATAPLFMLVNSTVQIKYSNSAVTASVIVNAVRFERHPTDGYGVRVFIGEDSFFDFEVRATIAPSSAARADLVSSIGELGALVNVVIRGAHVVYRCAASMNCLFSFLGNFALMSSLEPGAEKLVVVVEDSTAILSATQSVEYSYQSIVQVKPRTVGPIGLISLRNVTVTLRNASMATSGLILHGLVFKSVQSFIPTEILRVNISHVRLIIVEDSIGNPTEGYTIAILDGEVKGLGPADIDECEIRLESGSGRCMDTCYIILASPSPRLHSARSDLTISLRVTQSRVLVFDGRDLDKEVWIGLLGVYGQDPGNVAVPVVALDSLLVSNSTVEVRSSSAVKPTLSTQFVVFALLVDDTAFGGRSLARTTISAINNSFITSSQLSSWSTVRVRGVIIPNCVEPSRGTLTKLLIDGISFVNAASCNVAAAPQLTTDPVKCALFESSSSPGDRCSISSIVLTNNIFAETQSGSAVVMGTPLVPSSSTIDLDNNIFPANFTQLFVRALGSTASTLAAAVTVVLHQHNGPRGQPDLRWHSDDINSKIDYARTLLGPNAKLQIVRDRTYSWTLTLSTTHTATASHATFTGSSTHAETATALRSRTATNTTSKTAPSDSVSLEPTNSSAAPSATASRTFATETLSARAISSTVGELTPTRTSPDTGTLTIVKIDPPYRRSILEGPLGSVYAVASLLSFNPQQGAAMSRQRRLLRLAQGCSEDGGGRRDTPEIAASPLQLELGDDEFAATRGILIGMILFTLIFGVVFLIASALVAKYLRREFSKGLRVLRMPSMLTVPVFILAPEASSAAGTLVAFAPGSTIIVVVGVAVGIVLPIVCCIMVVRKANELGLKPEKPDKNNVGEDDDEAEKKLKKITRQQQQLEREGRKKNKKNSSSKNRNNNSSSSSDDDEVKDRMTLWGLVAGMHKYLMDPFADEYPETKFLQHYGMVFDNCRISMFAIFDFILASVVVGFLEGSVDGPADVDACVNVSAVCIVIFAVYLIVMFALHPCFIVRLDYLAFGNGLCALATAILNVLLHLGNKRSGSDSDVVSGVDHEGATIDGGVNNPNAEFINNAIDIVSFISAAIGGIQLLCLLDVVMAAGDLAAAVCGGEKKKSKTKKKDSSKKNKKNKKSSERNRTKDDEKKSKSTNSRRSRSQDEANNSNSNNLEMVMMRAEEEAEEEQQRQVYPADPRKVKRNVLQQRPLATAHNNEDDDDDAVPLVAVVSPRAKNET